MAHLILCGFINLLVISLSRDSYRYMLLKRLQKQAQPNFSTVGYYYQYQIVSNVMHLYEYDASTMVLSGVFLLCIIFCNVFVIAFREKMYIFIFISLGLLIVAIGLLNILFGFGCSFYTSSSKILFQWKRASGKSAILRRILNSLQIIAIPAGEAGIIDIDIKGNYLYRLLENCTSSVLTMLSLT